MMEGLKWLVCLPPGKKSALEKSKKGFSQGTWSCLAWSKEIPGHWNRWDYEVSERELWHKAG